MSQFDFRPTYEIIKKKIKKNLSNYECHNLIFKPNYEILIWIKKNFSNYECHNLIFKPNYGSRKIMKKNEEHLTSKKKKR